MRYYVGTRGSKLALVQTNYVIDRLKEAYPEDEFESVVIKTTGTGRWQDTDGSTFPKGYAGGTGSRTDFCQSLEA